MPIKLSIKQAVSLLESGYVRWTKQETVPGQSLQSYFGLNTAQMQQLLKRPELKNKRTVDNMLIFEEDNETSDLVETVLPTMITANNMFNEANVENIQQPVSELTATL